MPPVVSRVEIACPPDDVVAYVTDPSRFPEWQDDVVRVRMEGGRPPSVGARFTTTRRIGRVEQTTTQEITELSPPRSWACHGAGGPFRPSAGITVEPLDDGTRSRVTIALDFEGRGIGKLLPLDVIRRMAAKTAPRSYRNLKERLERGA
jgi:carbon monoxide dehydrogenase subunit G